MQLDGLIHFNDLGSEFGRQKLNGLRQFKKVSCPNSYEYDARTGLVPHFHIRDSDVHRAYKPSTSYVCPSMNLGRFGLRIRWDFVLFEFGP